ncbi:unnamed protein product [Plutella xylostella]|uniref:Cytoplasmic dynein 2 light intermediate chain 1 n=1 Tax=Plutella xylostella TaxID=51655 RepID=A0A8S4G8M5_PLUXY|nr:unnamed protein product [Plutella xylostella]
MLSIPDLATQIVDKSIKQSTDINCSTIFVVGNKSVGKSTLLYSFLDKTDNLRETLILEYLFGRKSVQKQGIDKNICHVWEYGGSLNMLKNVLPSVPIRGNYTYCIMLDLSKVKHIWHTLETSVKAFQDSINMNVLIKKEPELIIIGGKYDIFKNYDMEIKKVICNSLRSVAVLLKGNLIFFSSKEQPLVRRVKEVFHGIGFGNGFPVKDKVSNFNKPIYIPKGLDSWENIGIAPSTMEQIKARHLSMVPSETEIQKVPSTGTVQGSTSTYAEPMLDNLVKLKYNDLRNLSSLDVSMNIDFYNES